MTAMIWPAVALWGFVALMTVLAVRTLRARGQALWVVVLGGAAAAVVGYIVGMAVLVAVTTAMFRMAR